jgi:hypothetical protein
MTINKADAILSLVPLAQFRLHGDDLTWMDERAEPSEAEIQAELERLQADYEAKEYQRQRAPEYPSLATLADALYWNSTGDSTKLDEYYAACAAVKAKYPKGGDS